MIYQIGKRTSLDLDFSIQNDFTNIKKVSNRIENALTPIFAGYGNRHKGNKSFFYYYPIYSCYSLDNDSKIIDLSLISLKYAIIPSYKKIKHIKADLN
jgi:hypothetical protein